MCVRFTYIRYKPLQFALYTYQTKLDGSRMCSRELESDLFVTLPAVLFGIICVHPSFGAFVVVIILYTTDGDGCVTDKSVSEYYTGHNGTDPVLKFRFII